MHFRRLACVILGIWLGGIFMMSLVATQNFRTVDRILLDLPSGASPAVKSLGYQNARMLLRWEAGEQNRYLFELWETGQIALGVAVLFILLFGSTEGKYALALSLLLLVIVVIERILLTPLMVSLGRLIDFVPPNVHSPDRVRFTVLHRGYSGLEVFKSLICILLLSKLLVRTRRKSGEVPGDIDVINKAYHRHVNR